MDLKVDPARVGIGKTGLLVRAQRDGKWGNVDIIELDRESLQAWVQSRGPVSTWATSTIEYLLGYDRGGGLGADR